MDSQQQVAAPLPASEGAPSSSSAVRSLFGHGVPEAMEFEAWWTERGGLKRYMTIVFLPAVGQFHVQCDDSKMPLTVAINNKRGEPLEAWDLHVGAVVDILGRQTTLMAASLATIHWLDENARRLWKIKEALERRANKFRPKSLCALDYGPFKRLASSKGSATLGGTVNLGLIAKTVNMLETELAQYQ